MVATIGTGELGLLILFLMSFRDFWECSIALFRKAVFKCLLFYVKRE